jgi:hypothetical protein
MSPQTFFPPLMSKQFGLAHFSIFGSPCFVRDYFNQNIFHGADAHLARNNIFVSAVSIREDNARNIFQKPHVNAIISSSFVVGLIEGPFQALIVKFNFFRASAPRPLSFAVALHATGPVIEILRPVA